MNDNSTPDKTPEMTPPTPHRRRGASPDSHYGMPAPYHASLPLQAGGGGVYGYPAQPTNMPYYGPVDAYGYGRPSGAGEEDSLLGAVTVSRMVRVCVQRWMTIAVIAVLGAVCAFAVYRTMPSIYEGSSTFEMSLRPKKVLAANNLFVEENFGQTDEILNTRLAKLRSRDVVIAVMQRYHTDNPSSVVPDKEILETLANNTEVALQRRTRLVRVTVRSRSPELAVALANAYSLAVDTYTQEENRQQGEKAVDWLKSIVETQKRDLARKDQEILDFRTANQIDTFEAERKKAEAAQLTLNADSVMLETQINRARELVKSLEAMQSDPGKFGALPEAAPRAETLLAAHQRLQSALTDRNVLLTRFTVNHPDVAAKEKEVEQLRQQFVDEVVRANSTAKANLDLLQGQLTDNRRRGEAIDKRASDLELKIVTAKMKLDTMLRERDVAEQNFRGVLNREREAALSVDDNAAMIKIVDKAQLGTDDKGRTRPVSPNPFVILPAGPILGILIGVLFVLLLDHLEDRITGITDVEHRIRLKVLAVLPHIRRAKREQVAMLSAEDRFSHFAEAFAGLRNLLDSPRYVGVSKVLLVTSTQPGEGKSCCSSNFALTCALSGQRTLLVDFDLRRPRLARIYGKNRKDFESLFHALSANDPAIFDRLPTPSGYPNLDLVCTVSSSKLSPANVLGSGIIASFIDWARQHYDRVVIDSPPFGLVSDAVALSALADGTVVLCCPDRTRFRPLKHAVRHLAEAGGHIIGVIVNDVDFGRAGMFGSYEYNYAYRYMYAGKKGYGYGDRKGDLDARTAPADLDAGVEPEAKTDASDPDASPAPEKKAGRGAGSRLAMDDDE